MSKKNMKFIALCGVFLIVSGHVQAQSTPEFDFSKSWSQAEEQNIASDSRNYLNKWSPSRGNWKVGGVLKSVTWPQDKAVEDCVTAIFPGPAKARLIFVLSAEGLITEATSDQTGYIEQCVKEKVIGLQMPIPPFAPYLICSTFEKTGEDQTKMSMCGASHIEKSCIRKGNSERCTSTEIN